VASERCVPEKRGGTIAVFGSSEPQPGDALYKTAYRLGTLLARARFVVVTGGYGGVMAGVSQGAREAGGRTLGITCTTFAARAANPYLTDEVQAHDLHDRTRELIERASGYVILPGKAGTLAELALLWALDRAGCLGGRPVVLLGTGWQPLIDLLERSNMLESSQIRHTHLARTPEEAVALLGATSLGAGDQRR
jgi:uncharacterized protein (TIGR00730 family)